MRDILARYNISPNRAGFIRCPFHQGDNTASLKIYKDSFHCFGCGADGDIFKFVMMMDGISFQDAFISLGGEYKKAETKNEARHRIRDIKIAKQKRAKGQADLLIKKQRILELAKEIDWFRDFARHLVPFTDLWCECIDSYTMALIEFDMLWEEVHKDGNKC